MLLTTTRHGRDILREIKVYPVIRETHLQIEDEGVREACERLVQVLMRDEEGEEKVNMGMKALEHRPNKRAEHPQPVGGAGCWANIEQEGEEDEDEDNKIVEV
jgi:hypothetical protein